MYFDFINVKSKYVSLFYFCDFHIIVKITDSDLMSTTYCRAQCDLQLSFRQLSLIPDELRAKHAQNVLKKSKIFGNGCTSHQLELAVKLGLKWRFSAS